MPSDKHIIAKAIGLISSLFNVTSSQDMFFANRSSSSAWIVVLLKLTFVFLSFLHSHVGDDLWYA